MTYEKPPYTPGLREVLKLSKAEAGRLGHTYIGPDHYLLGIVRKGDGLAAQTLHNLEIDLDEIKGEVERIIEIGKGPTVGLVAPNLEAKRVLQTTHDIAAEMKHGWVGTEHLILGLIKEEGTLPSKILRGMGLDFERVRSEVLNVIEGSDAAMKSGSSPAPPAFKKGRKAPMRRLWVYVDASVFLGTEEKEVAAYSHRFFVDLARARRYLALLSPLTLVELSGAPEAVRTLFSDLPDECVEEISLDFPQVDLLAQAYIDAGAVTKSHRADAVHVAAATVARADLFLSWNYSRLVNIHRMHAFNGVNVSHGFGQLDFRCPLQIGELPAFTTYDCVDQTELIRTGMLTEYDLQRHEQPSLVGFVKTKTEESEWVRQIRAKRRRKEED